MTKKNKQLLLVDLCARLPYKVVCRKDAKTVDGESFYLDEYPSAIELTKYLNCDIEINIKPYLRPMNSMTEEEVEKYYNIVDDPNAVENFERLNLTLLDWLNKHHFDYRGLIEKGLAIEAKEGIYNVK